VKPPSARRASQDAASCCQPRGQVAKATSMARLSAAPTAPSARQADSWATPGEEAMGKFTAARAPSASAFATKARAAARSTASGFSRKTALSAPSAASASGICARGGAAM
jgi:hypothetical protein